MHGAGGRLVRVVVHPIAVVWVKPARKVTVLAIVLVGVGVGVGVLGRRRSRIAAGSATLATLTRAARRAALRPGWSKARRGGRAEDGLARTGRLLRRVMGGLLEVMAPGSGVAVRG